MIMATSHTRLAKFIHWSFVGLYLYGIVKQVDDLSSLEDSQLLCLKWDLRHYFFVIVLVRYFYMRRFETLQGATVPVHIVHRRFARAVHISMYLCLIMLPVTGLMIAGLYSQGYRDATPDESQTVMDVVTRFARFCCRPQLFSDHFAHFCSRLLTHQGRRRMVIDGTCTQQREAN